MAVTAFILVQTEVGRSSDVAKATAKVEGVDSANEVTGPYDVIVKVHAPHVEELGRLVVSRIQTITGITRTLTCPVIDHPGF